MGNSEKNTLKGNLMILLAHLLKLKVQHNVPDSMKVSWYSSVPEHCQWVFNNLVDTPSLKSYLVEAVEKAKPRGRKLVIKKEKLAKFEFHVLEESENPITCPFLVEAIFF